MLSGGSQWVQAQPGEPLSRFQRQLPFQGRLDRADRASPERGGACKAGGEGYSQTLAALIYGGQRSCAIRR